MITYHLAGNKQKMFQMAVFCLAVFGLSTLLGCSPRAGLKNGTTGGASDGLAVDVVGQKVISLEVSPAQPMLLANQTKQLKVYGRLKNGSAIDVTSLVTWVTSASTVATFDGATVGLLRAVGNGQAQVSVALGGLRKSVNVMVSAAYLTAIEVSPTPIVRPKGVVQQFLATGIFSDGTSQDLTESVNWEAVAPAIASVSDTAGSKGRSNMNGLGITTITASLNGVHGQSAVTVTNATLVSIQTQPPSLNLPLGTTQQVRVMGVYTDGTTADLTLTASWSSSNSAVVSVNKNNVTGLLGGEAIGAASITITVGSVTTVLPVNGTSAVLTALNLNPENVTLANGVSRAFTVTGTFSDGSAVDLTSQATWTSSNGLLGFVSDLAGSKGVMWAQSVGSVTLKASYGGMDAQTPVTITNATLSSIQISPASSTTFAKGITRQFTATGIYSDGTTADLTSQAVWSSSSTPTATISNGAGSNGLVLTRALGNFTVTAKVNAVTGTGSYSVTSAVLTRIQFSPDPVQIPKGANQAVTATGVYSDGSIVDLTNDVVWTTSNSAVATVSNSPGSKGLVTGVSPGTAVITGTVNGVTEQFTVTISAASLSSLAITPAPLTLPKGVSQQFTVTGTYSDGSTLDLTTSANWVSSNSAIFSVSSANGTKGLGQAVATGSITITATVGSVSATAAVQVTNATLSSLDIQPSSLSLPVGQSSGLTATGTYSDGTTADLTTVVTWSSSSASVANVSNAAGLQGQVVAGAIGSATITAVLGNRQAQMTVTVTSASLLSISVTPSSTSIALGANQQFYATGMYSDGTTLDLTSAVAWSSSDVSLLTVANASGSEGLAHAVALGSVTLTASLRTVSGTASVQVSNASLLSISVTPATLTLPKGVSYQAVASAYYSDGTVVDVTESVTWATSDALVASVSTSAGTRGRLLAQAVGTAQITASLNGQSDTLDVTVTAASLSSLQITPSVTSIANGLNQQFTATGTYSDGSTQDITSTVTWASSATNVMTISNSAGTKGLSLAKAVGTTVITASSGAVSNTANVTVTAATLSSLELSPTAVTLASGLSQQFTATGIYSDGSTVDLTSAATWSTTNAAVFVVSNTAGTKGLVTAQGVGMATLTASYGGQQAQASVTVTSATLTAINVTAPAASLAKGTTLQFSASGTYSDGSTQDITTSVNWSSANSGVLSVSSAAPNKGLATGMAVGSTTITAALGGVSGSLAASVTNAVLSSIAVSPASPSIAKGLTQQLTATGTYSDASTADLTNSVTWSSSDALVAPVSGAAGSKGLVSGLATGNATITATLTAVSGTATVSVTTATLQSIAVTHSGTNLAKGLTRQLTAIGTYSDASTSDLTNAVVWTTSASGTIGVSNAAGSKGRVNAVAASGTATITATLGLVTGTTTVTATAPVLVSVAVTPSELDVIIGLNYQLTATGTYSDGSTADVTTSANWATTNGLLAGVNNTTHKGRASAIALGDVTISATFGGFTGTMIFHSVLF